MTDELSLNCWRNKTICLLSCEGAVVEIVLLILLLIGALCGMVGGIWIVVIAIKNGDLLYGIGGLFCGLLLLIYAIQNLDECKIPLGLMVIGTIASVVLNFMSATVQ
jgi:hypothetical protein